MYQQSSILRKGFSQGQSPESSSSVAIRGAFMVLAIDLALLENRNDTSPSEYFSTSYRLMSLLWPVTRRHNNSFFYGVWIMSPNSDWISFVTGFQRFSISVILLERKCLDWTLKVYPAWKTAKAFSPSLAFKRFPLTYSNLRFKFIFGVIEGVYHAVSSVEDILFIFTLFWK